MVATQGLTPKGHRDGDEVEAPGAIDLPKGETAPAHGLVVLSLLAGIGQEEAA